MQSEKKALRTGRILAAFAGVFLLFGGVAKVLEAGPIMDASAKLEISERVIPGLGSVLIAAVLIYALHSRGPRCWGRSS